MSKNLQTYLVPGSIIVAGILISVGLFYGEGNDVSAVEGHGQPQEERFGNNNSPVAENIRPIDEDDHIRGDRGARVSIVEFSDFECPFCARLHPTLIRITQEYEGEVNWVYRHLPLSIHKNAISSARASECVAGLAGNEAFWEFSDALFNNQNSLGQDLYNQLALKYGITVTDLQSCMNSSVIIQAVDQDAQDAARSGGRGTPYVVVVRDDGAVFPFSGALRYDQVRGIIEQALRN